MSKLLSYIEKNNLLFIEKIIKAIKDDKACLIDLGVSELDLDKKILNPNFITRHMSNRCSQLSIDTFLKHVIVEYLYDDEELSLIEHYVSAGSFTSRRALYVFKTNEMYYCYDYDSKKQMKSTITSKPELLCRNIASSIIEDYKLEKENLNDPFFENSDPLNNLKLNFNFLSH